MAKGKELYKYLKNQNILLLKQIIKKGAKL
jgi:hypothetical protein